MFHKSVRQLKQELTYKELYGWIAYYELHPFGDDWDQTAVLAEIASIQASESTLPKPLTRDQIIPYQENQRISRLLKLKQKLDKMRGKVVTEVMIKESQRRRTAMLKRKELQPEPRKRKRRSNFLR